MVNDFKASFFKANRAKLLASVKADVIVLTASGLMQKSADEAYPFRQDSSFWYLTGIDQPDIILVMTRTDEFLVVPSFAENRVLVEEVDFNNLSRRSGVNTVYSDRDGWQSIRKLLGSNKSIGTLMPNPTLIKHYGVYSNPARRQLYNRLKRLAPTLGIEDLRLQLARQRMVKQSVEFQAIKKATDITVGSLKAVVSENNLKKLGNTLQIAESLTTYIKEREAEYGFYPMVASGKAASVVHYDRHDQALSKTELLLLDIGAKVNGYTSDISRTLAYGSPTPRQIAVYEAVKTVQAEAFKLIKPGMDYRKYEKKVEHLIGEQLIKLGLIKSINRKSVRRYYPHASSHSLGLDAHDAADYLSPLPVGMVLTVEPGIYIPEEGIGARLEDVHVITKDGNRRLSESLPTKLKL